MPSASSVPGSGTSAEYSENDASAETLPPVSPTPLNDSA